MSHEINFSIINGLAVIQLNRPQALNALNHAMCEPLERNLRAWATDASVKAVLIKAAGEKAFCAGGDIRRLADRGPDGDAYRRTFFADEYRINTIIAEYPKPFIALIDGIFMGGGVGLSVHGSHRVVSEHAVFAMPETGIGLFPDVGGTYFLPRLPGETGMYLGLTGTRLKVADILAVKIGTHHVPRARLAGLEAALADAPLPDRAAVDTVLAGFTANPGPAPIMALQPIIDRLFAGDSVAAVMAALEADESAFAQEQAAIIRTKSPTSVKITFAQLRRGRRLAFRDCMKLEWRMCIHVAEGPDFYEGVRAVIIDKDQKPKWNPPTLDAVTDAYVEGFFAPLPEGELQFG